MKEVLNLFHVSKQHLKEKMQLRKARIFIVQINLNISNTQKYQKTSRRTIHLQKKTKYIKEKTTLLKYYLHSKLIF